MHTNIFRRLKYTCLYIQYINVGQMICKERYEQMDHDTPMIKVKTLPHNVDILSHEATKH